MFKSPSATRQQGDPMSHVPSLNPHFLSLQKVHGTASSGLPRRPSEDLLAGVCFSLLHSALTQHFCARHGPALRRSQVHLVARTPFTGIYCLNVLVVVISVKSGPVVGAQGPAPALLLWKGWAWETACLHLVPCRTCPLGSGLAP